MIKIETTQSGLLNKIQKQLYLSKKYNDKYKLNFGGSCAHTGKLPKGCGGCYSQQVKPFNGACSKELGLLNMCTADCPYCFHPKGNGSGWSRKVIDGVINLGTWETQWQCLINNPNHHFNYHNVIFDCIDLRHKSLSYAIYNFTGLGAEPLLYLPVLKEMLLYFRRVTEPIILAYSKYKSCFKLYTNGKLLTEEISKQLGEYGINEIRVNVAAHHFTDEIYRNVEAAKKYIETVCVEVAVYPPYAKQLFEMIDILEQLKIDNLSLCQIKCSDKERLNEISKLLPEYYFYKGFSGSSDGENFYVLNDNGLTEQLIEHALDKNVSYSILDCNVFTLGFKEHELTNDDMAKVFRLKNND